MKYISAILSLLMHAFLIFLICQIPFDLPNGFISKLNIELVSSPIAEKEIAKSVRKPHVQPKIKKVDKIKTDRVDVDIKKSRESSSKLTRGRVVKQPSKAIHKDVIPSTSPLTIIQPKNKNAIVLKQGKGLTFGNTTIVVKRGSEGRTFDNLAAESFSEDDFTGHYETETGRSVMVVDARQEHGRLVLHDKKTGLTRKLKKAGYGDFIYTYGPSYNEDLPVEGSVTFLPGDEHWIRRFMWLPGNAAAEYPTKGRVSASKDIATAKSNNLFIPADNGKHPAVIIGRFGESIPDDQFSEVARNLSGKGVVVLVVAELTPRNIITAVKKIRQRKDVYISRVGVWLRGYKPDSIPKVLKSVSQFDFAVLTIDSPRQRLHPERLVAAIPENVPLFAGFRNVNSEWEEKILISLSGLQSAPHQLVMLKKVSTIVETGTDLESFDSLSGDFVSSISAWLVSR